MLIIIILLEEKLNLSLEMKIKEGWRSYQKIKEVEDKMSSMRGSFMKVAMVKAYQWNKEEKRVWLTVSSSYSYLSQSLWIDVVLEL